MKQMINKKGNGIVILTADEYAEIIDAVFKANNMIEYAISAKEILDSEIAHEERTSDSEKKAGYRLAQGISIKTIGLYLNDANEELKKLNEKF